MRIAEYLIPATTLPEAIRHAWEQYGWWLTPAMLATTSEANDQGIRVFTFKVLEN